MDWIPTLLIIPWGIVVLIVWDLLLGLLLRPWIRLPLFRFRRGQEPQNSLKRLGATPYILVVGILQFGWPMFVAMSLWKYLGGRYWGQSVGKLSVRELVVLIVVWAVCGIWAGCASWNRTVLRNGDEMTVRK